MTTINYTNEMPYTYNPNHKGAPYLIEGAYKNHGEYIESAIKFHMGIDFAVNPATSFDNGSDIECLSASVKSSGATLASIYGNSFDEIKADYFSRVHSTLWIWGTEIDGIIYEYHMNKAEFSEFIDTFATLTTESSNGKFKIRMKKDSLKMLRWFEAHL